MGEKSIYKGNTQNIQSVLGSDGNNNDAGNIVPTALFPIENTYDMQPVPTRKSGRTTKMLAKFNDCG